MTGRTVAPRLNHPRLLERIAKLAEIGAIEGGGVCRLALTEADKAGRDLVVGWMRELGLQISIDAIGNIVGLRPSRTTGAAARAPVMTGSHIDTVRTGGRYDGNLGVLAGLEVMESLNEAGVETEHPLAVAVFTNEEGARFAPDMMGSLVYVGGLPLEDALATEGIDGTRVDAELRKIGYDGAAPVGAPAVRAFVELHVEQGPVLEREGVTLGAVESLQGISWTEFSVSGVSNHAGTTPMRLRHDAGYLAGATITFVRDLTRELGGDQVGTVGAIEFGPNLVNVIPNRARFTVDLRNTDEDILQEAERRLRGFVAKTAEQEGLTIEQRQLARFEPVLFDAALVARIEEIAGRLGHSVRRLPSGAGHDAQMLARICPAAMIFVPSVGGISHNVREFTDASDIAAGADVLLHILLELAS
ncbi:Zn-dependent hydrolase [Algihabitans albus]|uniref:Zn-dependent hydrolase n=1 Tax=Algihabitans albus TaxID=2164067 RepID=UPI000E5CBDE4|nr:Zn-dependent hydrolase [Algihabitans albus]